MTSPLKAADWHCPEHGTTKGNGKTVFHCPKCFPAATPKPVKAWAFVNPQGEYIGVRFEDESEVWQLAFDAYRKTKGEEGWERKTFNQAKTFLKKNGYRCIKVQITPLVK